MSDFVFNLRIPRASTTAATSIGEITNQLPAPFAFHDVDMQHDDMTKLGIKGKRIHFYTG